MLEQYPTFRSRVDMLTPGLIRLDRAIPYITQRLARAIESLESVKTKSLGEDAYSILARLVEQIFPLCRMSGDEFLTERVGLELMRVRRVNPRTPRPEIIQALKNLVVAIDTYEPQAMDSQAGLLDAQNGESAKKSVPEDLAKEGSLFVIMPFSKEFNDVWKGAIQSASKTANFHPIRVDTINRSTNITDDIVESIKKCRIAAVDVTGNNPNVMYELGYVMALEKPYVIMSQSVDFLPFDIRNIRTIIYSNTWSGIEELRGKLLDFLRDASGHSRVGRGRKIAKSSAGV